MDGFLLDKTHLTLGREPALEAYNAEARTTVEIRQRKYLHNLLEQDHRFVKQKMRAAFGFKT